MNETEIDRRYVWVDRGRVETPPGQPMGNVTVYRDCWWMVNDKGQVAFFDSYALSRIARGREPEPWRSPQCNPHRTIAEKVGKHCPEYAGVVQIPIAYVPHRCE